jgi:hypothetical protein
MPSMESHTNGQQSEIKVRATDLNPRLRVLSGAIAGVIAGVAAASGVELWGVSSSLAVPSALTLAGGLVGAAWGYRRLKGHPHPPAGESERRDEPVGHQSSPQQRAHGAGV